MTFFSEQFHNLGLVSSPNVNTAKNKMEKRASLGLHPIGLTAVIALLLILTTEFCIRIVFLSLFKKSKQNFKETFEAYLSLISWLTMKVISKITFK